VERRSEVWVGRGNQHDSIARPKISLSLVENEASQKLSLETENKNSLIQMNEASEEPLVE
jgi:hypothetical protein